MTVQGESGWVCASDSDCNTGLYCARHYYEGWQADDDFLCTPCAQATHAMSYLRELMGPGCDSILTLSSSSSSSNSIDKPHACCSRAFAQQCGGPLMLNFDGKFNVCAEPSHRLMWVHGSQLRMSRAALVHLAVAGIRHKVVRRRQHTQRHMR